MKRRLIPMAAAIVLITTAALAQRPMREAGANPGMRGPQALAKYLGLSDDQIAAAKQIHADTQAAIKPLAEQVKTTRQQLDAALDAASPDPAAVGALAISMHQTIVQIRAVRDAGEAKFVALLTPDQKTKFADFQAMRQAAGRSRRRG